MLINAHPTVAAELPWFNQGDCFDDDKNGIKFDLINCFKTILNIKLLW